jgi:hypothetical protein
MNHKNTPENQLKRTEIYPVPDRQLFIPHPFWRLMIIPDIRLVPMLFTATIILCLLLFNQCFTLRILLFLPIIRLILS